MDELGVRRRIFPVRGRHIFNFVFHFMNKDKHVYLKVDEVKFIHSEEYANQMISEGWVVIGAGQDREVPFLGAEKEDHIHRACVILAKPSIYQDI